MFQDGRICLETLSVNSLKALMIEASTHRKRPCCWERLKAKEEGVRGNVMVRQHHQLNGYASEQTPGDSGAHRSLKCTFMGSQRVRHDSATKQQQQH